MHFERTADSDTVLTYQVASAQLVTNKKLEALNKAQFLPSHLWDMLQFAQSASLASCSTLRACDH